MHAFDNHMLSFLEALEQRADAFELIQVLKCINQVLRKNLCYVSDSD